jgi:glutamate-1-semialdehyde 2,1-aminomutase
MSHSYPTGKAEAHQRILNGKNSQEVRRKLISRTPKSAAAKASGGKHLSQEIVQTVDLPHAVYIDSAEGAYLTDLDGNQYIDMTMGFGPYVLGHKPPCVEKALQAQIGKGWQYGIPSTLQLELSDLLQAASPCSDNVVFANTGTEATMYAMRAARAFTGKEMIASFDGSYHGAHDDALIHADPTSNRERPEAASIGQGIPASVRDQSRMVLPYRRAEAFDLIRENKDKLAAVIIEPAQNSNPRTGLGEFLQQLRDVCTETGVLLIFDEVVTGFRLAYGGAQELYGITPDLAAYGKALAHGLPVGAVGGRADIMRGFSGEDMSKWIFCGGTFNGNPLTMAAGVAAVTEMRDTRDTLYPYINGQTNRLATAVNTFCEQEGFGAHLFNAGSMLHMRFEGHPVKSSFDFSNDARFAEREFYLQLLGHGVFIPGVHLAFISGAHTEQNVDTIIDAFKQSFRAIREDGLF